MSSNLFKKKVKSALTVAALIFGGNFYAQLGLNWSEMGPNDVGGRCRAFIVDKLDGTGKTVYAAGVSGGVFRSINGGSNWYPINDTSSCMIVSSMAQAANGAIYIGTGETFGRGGDGAGLTGFAGKGLYKFNPGGNIFQLVKDSSAFGNINEVACDKTDINKIYVASEKGLKISTDGGATWTSAGTGTTNIPAMDVKVDAVGGVYFVEGTTKGSTSEVYYSATGASGTYNKITPPSLTTNRGRMEIATAPSDANVVYLSVANSYPNAVGAGVVPGGLKAVFVSNTKGASWTLITLGTSQFDPFTFGKGYGDYVQTLVVSPSDPYYVFLGGYTCYYWRQTSSTLGQGTWTQLGIEFYINQYPFSQLYLHPKIHDLKFSPAGYLYAATDGGIYRLATGGTFGGSILPFNNGFNTAQFNSVSMQNYPYNKSGNTAGSSVVTAGGVAGGTNGNALCYLPGNLVNSMASISYNFDNAYQTDFSKILPNALFYSGSFGSIYRTVDVNVNSPATFYDNTYKTIVGGGPGSSFFASENTPMRLWENYGQVNPPTDSIIFLNAPIKTSFVNLNKTQTSFTVALTRPQRSAKYDSIYVVATSTKKTGQGAVTNYSINNTVPMSAYAAMTNTTPAKSTFTVANVRPNSTIKYDSIKVKLTTTKALSHPTISVTSFSIAIGTPSTQTTFTFGMTRPQQYAKYDSIIIKTTSFKVLSPPTPSVQTIRIKPAYTGSVITGYSIAGTTGTPNIVYNNTSLSDSIKYTFGTAPRDSSNTVITIKYKYYQNLTILPAYTGTAVSGYTVLGEAVNTPTTNNMVFVNSSLSDSIRFTAATAPDSSNIQVWSKYKTQNTFTVAHTRANVVSKYDSIVVRTISNKLGVFKVPTQTITIVPAYNGTVITGYNIAGSTSTNNLVFQNSSLSDSIRFTFNNSPNDSSAIFIRIKNKYYQNLIIVPTYTTGGVLTGTYNITGEANTSSASNNTVTLKPTLLDSIRFTFKTAPDDSTTISTVAKLRYNVGDYVTMNNEDITGVKLRDSSLISTALYSWSNPPYRKIRLVKSARLAIGLNGCIAIQKRPLNFATALDFIKLTGTNSRCDSGSTTKAKQVSQRGMVTKLEWSNDGRNIYFSTKANDTTYYFYRVSGIDFLGDSTNGDYTGMFTSDVDSTGNKIRKSVKTRLTPLGKFKYPVTSISVLTSDTGVLVTTGSYKNKLGTVYFSNGNIKKAPVDSSYALTNFTLKNGTGSSALPLIPAYSSLFEMSNNKRVLVGTETGLYSTSDITAANPTWVKEVGTGTMVLPSVPVFQIRQQTLPNWYKYGSSAAFNSGMIYVATHGRGIWSTDKYLAPFNIGIEETVSNKNTFSTSMKLYPNPTSNDVNVWFNTATEGDFKLTVMDVSGRVVLQYNAGKLMEGEQIVPLNTSSLTSGIYFVNVNGSNDFNSVSKLVISK